MIYYHIYYCIYRIISHLIPPRLSRAESFKESVLYQDIYSFFLFFFGSITVRLGVQNPM